MGLINKIFGTSKTNIKEEKILPWIDLNSEPQLNEILKKSKGKTQLIFKHSTRCGISKMVINQFVSRFDVNSDIDLYYLDLLSYRNVSDAVAEKFQVWHQSPQLLVIKNGKTVAHASHAAINQLDYLQF